LLKILESRKKMLQILFLACAAAVAASEKNVCYHCISSNLNVSVISDVWKQLAFKDLPPANSYCNDPASHSKDVKTVECSSPCLDYYVMVDMGIDMYYNVRGCQEDLTGHSSSSKVSSSTKYCENGQSEAVSTVVMPNNFQQLILCDGNKCNNNPTKVETPCNQHIKTPLECPLCGGKSDEFCKANKTCKGNYCARFYETSTIMGKSESEAGSVCVGVNPYSVNTCNKFDYSATKFSVKGKMCICDEKECNSAYSRAASSVVVFAMVLLGFTFIGRKENY